MKVVTMVGTSIFENFFENNDNSTVRNYYEDLKNKRENEYARNETKINAIKKAITNWINKEKEKFNISAEIKSLTKISEELNEYLEVYLLASDTVLSRIGGEILQEWIPNIVSKCEIKKLEVIKDLQIWNRKDFNKGMSELIGKIYKISNEYWDNVIINITGGYKATIPYLTILAQVNQCPIYYIFEDTDAIIEIPHIPIDIKWEIFEKYKHFFYKLEREGIIEFKDVNNKDYQEVKSILEHADSLFSLNPLGVTLWERYKRKFDLFYVSKEYDEYIKNNKQYQKIAEKSLLELKRRLKENPSNPDLDHKLKNVNFKEFKCFKHKEEDLQVRILYKAIPRETRYGTREFDIYIGSLRIGRDVHNAESEYVEDFNRIFEKIKDTQNYKLLSIQKKEVQNV
ncbi:putative CRISPR-associated protein [Thermodesulfovibrio sp. TK110]